MGLPSIHGGVLYFNKAAPDAKMFFETCENALLEYDDLGCKRMFRGGMTDEIIFSIAMARHEYRPLDYVEHPIVSFDLPSDTVLPCYYHTRNGQRQETYQRTRFPVIFNHVFFHEDRSREREYRRWIERICLNA
jgi:hypothetical protein